MGRRPDIFLMSTKLHFQFCNLINSPSFCQNRTIGLHFVYLWTICVPGRRLVTCRTSPKTPASFFIPNTNRNYDPLARNPIRWRCIQSLRWQTNECIPHKYRICWIVLNTNMNDIICSSIKMAVNKVCFIGSRGINYWVHNTGSLICKVRMLFSMGRGFVHTSYISC